MSPSSTVSLQGTSLDTSYARWNDVAIVSYSFTFMAFTGRKTSLS